MALPREYRRAGVAAQTERRGEDDGQARDFETDPLQAEINALSGIESDLYDRFFEEEKQRFAREEGREPATDGELEDVAASALERVRKMGASPEAGPGTQMLLGQ